MNNEILLDENKGKNKMTLQEAIEHAREVSEDECEECKQEHEQLAEWLEELKNIKDILGNNYDLNMLQEILNICDGKTPNQIDYLKWRARWIGMPDDDGCTWFECSACEYDLDSTEEAHNFCPNCGMAMNNNAIKILEKRLSK